LATLREITLAEGVDFDPDTDMIVGQVTPPDGQESWDGDQLLYDPGRWLIRPGDLVGVDRSGSQVQPGIYVPMDAILEKLGAKYIFVVVESPDGDTVRQVEVKVHENVDTLRRIEAAGNEALTPGTKIVATGAAFLADGERVNVAKQLNQRR